MRRFRKILVGVDLSWCDRFVSDELSEPNKEAVRQAMWLARLNTATVDFLFSIELSARTQELITECGTEESNVLDEAKEQLAFLVENARKEGIKAQGHVVIGRSWVELIRQVLRNQNDLVLVGTHHRSSFQDFFLGSTGIKLLRKCPCPVWITQPWNKPSLDSILVAHDLRSVGDLAMQLGCSMASLQEAQLHVVHAAEHLDFDFIFPASISAKHKRAYGNESRSHIEAQLAGLNLPRPAAMHFVIDPPEVAIMRCIEQYRIDLLVMGTVGRTGISGCFTGTTAERLLPRIPCSLLAVKPPSFQTPVSLDESEAMTATFSL